MALNFPNNPSPGDYFTDGNKTYLYNGVVWESTLEFPAELYRANDYLTYTTLSANDRATYINAVDNAYILAQGNDWITYDNLSIVFQNNDVDVYTAPSVVNFEGPGLVTTASGSTVTVNLTKEKVYNFVGGIELGLGSVRWYPVSNIVLTSMYLVASVPPVTGDFSVSVNVGGTSVGTAILTTGQYRSSIYTLNNAVSTNDSVTVDVNSVNGASSGALTILYSV